MTYLAHLVGLVGVTGLSLAVAAWVRRRTNGRTGAAAVAILVGHAAYALFVALQLLRPAAAWQITWIRIWYGIGLLMPVLWFLLAVYYTGRRHWLTRRTWAVLVACPAVAVGLWITDPVHGLLVAEFRAQTEPFVFVRPVYTDLAMTIAGLINLFTLFALGLFLWACLFSRRGARWRAGVVLGGLVAVLVTAILGGSSLAPVRGFPYATYGGGLFSAAIAAALFRGRMFAVLPMARDAVFEAVEDAIVVVDANGTVVDYNGAAERLLPALEGSVGRPLAGRYPELMPGDPAADRGDAAAIVERAEGSLGTPFAGTVEAGGDGDERTLRVSVSPVRSDDDPGGYVLILRDVTELERHAEELERKTQQLERFASVLSHDLRNPVAIATGYVQRTLQTDDPEHLEEAQDALARIDERIDDLLALAREGGEIDDPEPVALRSAAEAAWSTSDTGDADLVLEVEEDDRIMADRSRLRTALENLFRNAAEHGGQTVTVGRTQTGFFVADDGPGVPPEERDRIFEYGYSGDEGTGLGLAIVDTVATAHGWSASVEESDDGGARFEIEGVEDA